MIFCDNFGELSDTPLIRNERARTKRHFDITTRLAEGSPLAVKGIVGLLRGFKPLEPTYTERFRRKLRWDDFVMIL